MTKLFSKLVLAFVLIAISLTSIVGGPNITLHGDTERHSVVINFEQWNTTEVDIKIMSMDGVYVWTDRIDVSQKNALKYNLKELKNGQYTMQISDELTMTIQPIRITETGVVLNNQTQRILYKPVVRLNGEQLKVNQLLLGNSAYLKLVDEDYNTLYKERIKSSDEIAKIFDIKDLEAGNYTVLISTQGQLFENSFTVNK